MKKIAARIWKITTGGMLAVALSSAFVSTVVARGDDFSAVVKVIENYYHVKHTGIPFLAKAGIKTARVAARVAGGSKKRLAEAGSVKVAFFEDQEFNSMSGTANFRRALKATLVGNWLPFIQVLSLGDEEQTYIFLREDGAKYNVLVVTINKRDAAVVQVDLAPQTLAMLMQNPNEMGKAIVDDATTDDN
jgi:hypothetical protein